MAQHKQTNLRRSMGDQVRLLAPKIRSRHVDLPRITEIGQDGVHHINVWEEGETLLGRALSHMAHLPFTHSVYGPFDSIEGLWYYIQAETPDETLRTKSGFPALTAGRRTKVKEVANFRAIIAQANWEKINAYPQLATDLKDSKIRIEKYYLKEDGGGNPNRKHRQRTVQSSWIISMFEEIRYALQQGKQPDFDFLSDEQQAKLQAEFRNKGSNIDILSAYKSNQPAPAYAPAPKHEPKQGKQPQSKKPQQPFKEKPKGTFGNKPEAATIVNGAPGVYAISKTPVLGVPGYHERAARGELETPVEKGNDLLIATPKQGRVEPVLQMNSNGRVGARLETLGGETFVGSGDPEPVIVPVTAADPSLDPDMFKNSHVMLSAGNVNSAVLPGGHNDGTDILNGVTMDFTMTKKDGKAEFAIEPSSPDSLPSGNYDSAVLQEFTEADLRPATESGNIG